MKKPTLRLPAATLALAAAFTTLSASAQTWTGSTSNAWLVGSNWSGNIAPGATDTALFNSASANTNLDLSDNTTIGALHFAAGAAPYTISGSTLTIAAATGVDSVVHAAGNLQTISSNLTLSTGGRTINVGSGSTLTISGLLSAGGSGNNIVFNGGGTVNVGAVANNSVNQLQQSGGTTLNVNATASSTGTYFAVDNSGRINFNVSTARGAGTGFAGSGSGRVFITADGVNLSGTGTNQSIRFRAGNGADNTIGADIAGGGSASIAELRIESARTNATYRIHSSANNLLTISNVTGAAGTGTKFVVQGGGVVRFGGTVANTATAPIEVASGTRLELSKTAGIDAVSTNLSVLSGAEVRLLAADQIANTVGMTLSGGTFNANGNSESLGALSLSGAGQSIIDFGATGNASITFASLSSFSGSLLVQNWSPDKSLVFTDASGWTSERLAAVTFAGFGTGASLTGNTLTAIPEPSAFAALAGLGALGLAASRRRRRA